MLGGILAVSASTGWVWLCALGASAFIIFSSLFKVSLIDTKKSTSVFILNNERLLA